MQAPPWHAALENLARAPKQGVPGPTSYGTSQATKIDSELGFECGLISHDHRVMPDASRASQGHLRFLRGSILEVFGPLSAFGAQNHRRIAAASRAQGLGSVLSPL